MSEIITNIPKGFQIIGAGKAADIDTNIRRVLLCANPGEGKTYTTLTTCDEVVMCDFDKGITDPRLTKIDFQHLRMYNSEWCDKTFKKSVSCNAFMSFLKGDALKLIPEQTLFIDSLSTLNDSVQDYLWKVCPTFKGTQEKDNFAWWGSIKDWYVDFGKSLLELKCNVIMATHLEEVRKKEGGMFMHYAPMLQGSFKQRIGQFFSDVIRVKVDNKSVGDKMTTVYKWQIKPDSDFPMAKSRSAIDNMYIPANFKSLITI